MKGWHFAFSTQADGSGLGDPSLAQMIRMDWTPVPLDVEIEPPLLMLRKTTRDNGSIQIPYRVDGFGETLIPVTQLIQSDTPYRLVVELARGQLNQARHWMAESFRQGFEMPPQLHARLHEATTLFGQAVRANAEAEVDTPAGEALKIALWLAEDIVREQCVQVLRHAGDQLAAKSRLGCRLDEGVLLKGAEETFCEVFGHAAIGIRWADLEAEQGECRWDSLDRQIHWAVAKDLPITVGPVIDFANGLPPWLHQWSGEHETLLTVLTDRVESMMGRYRDCVARWTIVNGVNSADVLGLTESKMLWLTKRLIEAARSMDPNADLLVGIDQPWGDYVARCRRVYCPATFIDTLLRAQTGMTGIALELAMGFGDGGSFCRTLDSTAQILAHFSEFGLPLDVSLAFPSAPPSKAAGSWHGPFWEKSQTEWAESAAALCLAHGIVRRVTWNAWRDRKPMPFPTSGLFDETDEPKPALEALRGVRNTYLR